MSYPQTFGMGDPSHPQTFGTRDISHPQTFTMGNMSHSQTFGAGHMSHSQTFGAGHMSHPQTFGTGHMSHPQTFGTGHMSRPQTFGMGDNTINTNNNGNNNTLIGPHGWSIQNHSNSYQSQLSHVGADHSSHMMDHSTGLNYNQIPPMDPSHQSQQGHQKYYDIGFYADLLKNQIPSDNVNNEDMNQMGDGGNVYGSGEGIQVDHSSSLSMNPTMHNVNSNGMLNPVTGSYDQGGYNNYGFESGSLNFEDQQAAPGGSQAAFEPSSNQHRFFY